MKHSAKVFGPLWQSEEHTSIVSELRCSIVDVSIGHPSTSASTRRRLCGMTSHMPASNTRLPAKSQSLLLAPTVSASPTRKSVSVIPMCATRPA